MFFQINLPTNKENRGVKIQSSFVATQETFLELQVNCNTISDKSISQKHLLTYFRLEYKIYFVNKNNFVLDPKYI